MKQILNWVYGRGKCAVLGHDLKQGRFYYPPASDTVHGFVCDRCGKTQLLKYRWQD